MVDECESGEAGPGVHAGGRPGRGSSRRCVISLYLRQSDCIYHLSAQASHNTDDVSLLTALSHLIAASLAEDALGNVQRDIPRSLEALLSFLAEAEAYQAELESNLPPGAHLDEAANTDGHTSEIRAKAAKEVAQAVEVVLPVITGAWARAAPVGPCRLTLTRQALRMGVGLIAKTFGDRLSVYKFPPPTAKRLQSFMDYL